MIRIDTVEEALALLRRAVKEKGADYRYMPPRGPDGFAQPCVYFNPVTKEPDCIIGHVLAYKGMTAERLSSSHNSVQVHILCDVGIIAAPPSVQRVLREAQLLQDNGVTWGEALAAAERLAEES